MRIILSLLLSVASVLSVGSRAQVVIPGPAVRVINAGPGITVNTNGFTRTISAPGAAGDITGAAVTGGMLTVSESLGILTFGLSTNDVRAAGNGYFMQRGGGQFTGDAEFGYGAGYSFALGFRDSANNLYQLRITDAGVLQYIGVPVWHGGNDGHTAEGTGPNADLLDDEHGYFYRNWANITNTTAAIGPTQLASTAVTAASYTFGNGGFTVDADGRITSATSLSALSRALLPTSHTTPFVSWASTDCNFFTTAGVWWYPYENSGIDFGAAGLRAAAADDQLGTLRTRWTRVPHEAAAFKETGAIVLTFAVSSTAGVTECRGLRLMGRNLKTDTPTTLYTDTTTRDGHASSAGALVTFSIDRSAMASSTLYTDIQAEVDISVEDAEVWALESLSVRFE